MSSPSLPDGSSLEPILWEFDRAWICGEAPDIDAHLPAEEPRRSRALVELIASDLEWRLKAGQTVRVEDYLKRYPELRDDPRLIELVAAEFRLRRRAEPALGLEEYHARFPQLRDALAGAVQTRPMQASTPSSTSPPLPVVPGYEIVRELGRGGMGVVYEARHLGLGRVVALKMLLHAEHADSADLVRFLGEAEAVARLHHPNVVQLFETGRHNGLPYFTLEFVPGGSLADRLRDGPLPPKEAAALVQQMAKGVQHAHERGIVHRDLKPSNVLLGEDGTPKVADFGLARRVEVSGLTATGHVLGTPAYMAPEQAAGRTKEVGPAADVYALGAILYECLTGRPPFQAATALETLQQVLHDEPIPVRALQPGCPRDLETICHKCLHKDPARRYGTAGELADDLIRFLGGEPVRARPVGLMERVVKWVRRRPAVASLTAAVVLVALVGTALVSWNWRDAVRQRQLALEAAGTANAELERAEQNLYLNRIGLAQREWESNHIWMALNLLDACPTERRGWEWHYLHRLCQGSRLTLHGHTDTVLAVAFSPDGRHLASASDDKTVKVWDALSGQEVLSIKGHTDGVRSVAFSPDGTRIVSASSDKMVRVWDARTGQPIHTLKGHTSGVNAVAFSPDGARLASGDGDETVRVWDARTGQETLTLKGHWSGGVWITAVAFNPDGTRLVSASSDETVKVWDAQTGQETLTLKGHSGAVFGVAFSPDGTRIVSASFDKTVRVWDARTGQETLTLKGHTDLVSAVAFSPDGARLASASRDLTVKVWTVRTGQEAITLKGHTSTVYAVAFSPDGTRIASASSDKTVKVWDTCNNQESWALRGHTAHVKSVAFSPDGIHLASASHDKTVRVWDARTGQEALSLKGHSELVNPVAFSPDGARLASGGADETVKVWDARTGQEALSLKGHTRRVLSVAFSPDGTRIASAEGYPLEFAEAGVKVWDARTGQEAVSLKGHPFRVSAVAFSPDGTQLATAGNRLSLDGESNRKYLLPELKVWDLETGQEVLSIKGNDFLFNSVAFSPDGTRIASSALGHQPVKVWDARTGQEALSLKGHSGPVNALAFSPDGTRIASASDDQTVRVWDARTGQETLALKGHTDGVKSVAFSPDGTRIASASDDQTVRVWDARTGQEAFSANPAWHAHMVAEAELARDWFAAAFHANRLLLLRPDDREVVTQRDRFRRLLDEERSRLGAGAGRMQPVRDAVRPGGP